MAEVTQLTYKHEELLALMLKDQGISDGLWTISLNIALGVGNFAQPQSENADQNGPPRADPGALMAVQGIGMTRAPVMGPGVVDASKLSRAGKGRTK